MRLRRSWFTRFDVCGKSGNFVGTRRYVRRPQHYRVKMWWMGGEAQDADAIVSRIRTLAAAEEFRISQHAQEEMVAESILLAEVLEAIGSSQLLENYTEHRRAVA